MHGARPPSGGSAAAAEQFPPIALNRAPFDATAGDTGATLGAVALTLLEDEICIWRGTFDMNHKKKTPLKWYQKLFALCRPAKVGECGCGPLTFVIYKPKIIKRRNVMLTNKRLIIQVSQLPLTRFTLS